MLQFRQAASTLFMKKFREGYKKPRGKAVFPGPVKPLPRTELVRLLQAGRRRSFFQVPGRQTTARDGDMG